MNKKLKYSELMPDDTDNVLFNYHLQHLVKNGLLIKDENYYSLSPEGIKLTGNFTESGLYFSKFICKYKLYLINDDHILLQKCDHRPWYGETSPLTSKALYGVGTEERANVRMKEKVGIETNMRWVGTLRTIIKSPHKDLIDDSVYFICYATSYRGTLKKYDDSDHPLAWYSFDEAIRFEEKNPGSGDAAVEIMKRFKAKYYETFVFEEIVEATLPEST